MPPPTLQLKIQIWVLTEKSPCLDWCHWIVGLFVDRGTDGSPETRVQVDTDQVLKRPQAVASRYKAGSFVLMELVEPRAWLIAILQKVCLLRDIIHHPSQRRGNLAEGIEDIVS